jgi:hypothetical protein
MKKILIYTVDAAVLMTAGYMFYNYIPNKIIGLCAIYAFVLWGLFNYVVGISDGI